MKLTLPIHLGRISPLLDTAKRALVIETRDRGEALRSEISLPGDGGPTQLEALLSTGAERLVCSAVSDRLMSELLWHGLQVWPGVVG